MNCHQLHHHHWRKSSCHPHAHWLASGCTFAEEAFQSWHATGVEFEANHTAATPGEATFGSQYCPLTRLHHLPSWCSHWSLNLHHSQLDFQLQSKFGPAIQMQQRADAGLSIRPLKSFDGELAAKAGDGVELLNLLLCTSCGRNLWFNHLENSLKVRTLHHHLYLVKIVKDFERRIVNLKPQGHIFAQVEDLF